jgi:hypothetical protein
MGRLTVLFLFILIYSHQHYCLKSAESLAPHAITAVIDGYYAKNHQDVLMANFGKTNGIASRIIDELLKLGGSSIPVKIFKDKSQGRSVFTIPSVMFFDSPANFGEKVKWIELQRGFVISFPHLVYIHGATLDDIRIASNKNETIDKAIFLVNETPHSIELATAFLFTPQTCHINQFEVINRFIGTQMKWESSNFFVLKYGNLHGCPLVFNNRGDFNDIIYSKFAKELNFTIEKTNEKYESVQRISFHYGYFFEANHRLTEIHILDIEPRKIFIPPGEVYGEYEKMVLPFDTPTWIGIGLTIAVSCLTIVFIKKFNKSNQEIFFGRSNESPFMNFIDILLNGGQNTSLVENVPRIFLLTFVIWSLIFR